MDIRKVTPRTPSELTEKAIEKLILQYLSIKGIYALKLNTVGVFDQEKGKYRLPRSPFIKKGVSDIIAILKPHGQIIAIEVKTPKRKNNLSIHQKIFMDEVQKNGGISLVATSVVDVIKRLEELEDNHKILPENK